MNRRFALRRARRTGPSNTIPLAGPTPDLVLLLPEDFTEKEFGQKMSETFRQARDTLAKQERYWRRLADDEHGACLVPANARAEAFAQAVARLDEALVTAYGLSEQYRAWADSTHTR